MSNQDLYQALGLEKNASQDEIKRAYRKLAAKYHPDVNKEAGSEQKFKDIQNAYEILSDPQKKAQYDQFGTTGDSYAGGTGGAGFGGFSGGGGFDFSGGLGDIFETFFGGGMGSSGRARGPAQGRNLRAEMEIDFFEAVTGTKRKVSLESYVQCASCNGQGAQAGTGFTTCSSCKGTGQVHQRQRTPLGYVQTTSVCPDCQGEGRKPETPCSDCQGEGRVLKEQNISVNIPPGIFDGAVLNLKGKGEAGQRGQSAGDLLLKVYIRPSKDFRREGDSIHTDLELHFLQALLGDEVKIKTVHGTTKLKIPAGTQSEQVLRIKDQGMPVLNKAAFGDHFVHVKVRIPKKLSKKEKQLYSEAVKEAGLNITPEKGFLENIFN